MTQESKNDPSATNAKPYALSPSNAYIFSNLIYEETPYFQLPMTDFPQYSDISAVVDSLTLFIAEHTGWEPEVTQKNNSRFIVAYVTHEAHPPFYRIQSIGRYIIVERFEYKPGLERYVLAEEDLDLVLHQFIDFIRTQNHLYH